MKDLGELRYFLGIEVDKSSQGIFLSERKYVSDIRHQYVMDHCIPLKIPMDTHVKLLANLGDPLHHAEIYQKLVVDLIYLTVIGPYIAYTVHVLSHCMQVPTTVHFQAAKRVLWYLASTKVS